MDDGDIGGEVLMTFDLPEISEKLNISEILTYLRKFRYPRYL